MVLLLAALIAAQDPNYETTVLETGTFAHDIEARDVNGDGKTDLVIQNGRDLQVFLQKDGVYTPKPQQVLRLEPTAFLWTFAMLDGQKFPAVFTAGSRAVQAIPFDGAAFGPPRDLVVHPSLFEGVVADGRAPLFSPFAPDLDKDGRSDVLLFRTDEIFVMKQFAGGEFRCIQKLPVPMDVATVVPWAPHQKLTETLTVPLLSFGDTDGDQRIDIAYYKEESIGVFRQTAEGSFVVYYGAPGRKDWTQADQVMNVADGWSTGIYLEDLGGRGKLDLVMGVVRKFGITEGIQVFLSGKVDLELHIYPMGPEGRFTKDPVQEMKFSIPFSFHVTR